MKWFYDNAGVADGPHDDAVMAARVKGGVVGGRTLVWCADMAAWQETAALNPGWWQPSLPMPSAKSAPIIVARPQSATHRTPVPKAPSDTPPTAPAGGFLKRLFGFGKKG